MTSNVLDFSQSTPDQFITSIFITPLERNVPWQTIDNAQCTGEKHKRRREKITTGTVNRALEFQLIIWGDMGLVRGRCEYGLHDTYWVGEKGRSWDDYLGGLCLSLPSHHLENLIDRWMVNGH